MKYPQWDTKLGCFGNTLQWMTYLQLLGTWVSQQCCEWLISQLTRNEMNHSLGFHAFIPRFGGWIHLPWRAIKNEWMKWMLLMMMRVHVHFLEGKVNVLIIYHPFKQLEYLGKINTLWVIHIFTLRQTFVKKNGSGYKIFQ